MRTYVITAVVRVTATSKEEADKQINDLIWHHHGVGNVQALRQVLSMRTAEVGGRPKEAAPLLTRVKA